MEGREYTGVGGVGAAVVLVMCLFEIHFKMSLRTIK